MNRKLIGAGLGLVALVMAGTANAVPVRFDFSDTVGGNGSSIAGTSVGQSFDISIFADNGSASLISQVWGAGDYLSATVNIGGGVYTMSLDSAVSTFSAATDGSGNVSAMDLNDFLGNTDSLGNSGPGIFVNGFRNIVFPGDGTVADATNLTTPDNLTVSLVGSVPEPSGLALLGTGLAGMVLLRRRRQRKAA